MAIVDWIISNIQGRGPMSTNLWTAAMPESRVRTRLNGPFVRLSLTLFVSGIVVLSAACARKPAQRADTIFFNGPIITIEEDHPEAEALAIREGRIVAVGDRRDVMRWKGRKTTMLDLGGHTLLPGFIDAHGHLSIVAQVIALCNVASPPVGPVSNFDDLKREMLAYRDRMQIPAGGWIVGFGYDDSLLAEGRHPNRHDLDAISSENPVALIHVSAHLAALNSAALSKVGINAASKNPPGGVIRREAGSEEPDGVLEESAMMLALQKLPQPSEEQQLALLDLAQQEYARYGITTAQDGLTLPANLTLFRQALSNHRLIMDVVAYPAWFAAPAMMKDAQVGVYDGHFKIGGVKLVLDGSPQGKTAWLSKPYFVPPPGQAKDYCGYPAMKDAQIDSLVDRYFANNWQVLAHCNGDAAAEQLINAVEKASANHPRGGRRTVMIHAQTVRDDQLDRMAALSIMPSFFSAHAFYWGDWHRDSVLGPERAARISPARSAIERGIPFTIHNDSPVVPPDMMRLIWAAVNRETRNGKVLGPEQRITPAEAIRAVTLDAAYQYFEENEKGSLKPGKLANLTILGDNPMTAAPESLNDIPIEETWVEGVRIYSREEAATPTPASVPHE